MRPSRVLALGPVPDERLGALEQAGLGRELPLVLGRQPRADRRGVGTRFGEIDAGRRLIRRPVRAELGVRHLTARDREARRGDRVALDLDEVVQPRRQRLPFLDVRRLAVRPGLAAAEDGGDARRRGRAPRRNRSGTVASGAATGSAIRARARRAGNAGLSPPAPPSPARSRRRPRSRAPARSTSKSAPISRPENGSVRPVDDRPERRLAVRPARGDDLPDATPPLCAASGVHSPVASRSAYRRWSGSIARSSGLVPLVPAHPRAEDVLPDEHADAVQPGALQLLRVVAVPAARVVEHVPLLEPARPQHARHRAVGEPLRPREMVVADAIERHRRLAFERDAAAGAAVDGAAQLRVARPSSCRGTRRRRRARARARRSPRRRRPARGACRRPTGCSRRTHARRARGTRRRARGGRARRGRGRTGCARRSRSRDRRARARRRRSLPNSRSASAQNRSGVKRPASWS